MQRFDLTRFDLTMDADDATVLATFWKLVLGYEDEPPPAPFTTRGEWVESFGEPAGEERDGAWLHDPTGVGPRLSILRVPEPKVAKNRLHIDVRVSKALPANASAEQRWQAVTEAVERFVAAGASVLATTPGHFVVMADPEGNEFCVA